jgi:hypothetical protein
VGARAFVLVPEAAGAPTVAFVRLDLIVAEASLTDAVLERTRALGLSPATLLLSATHTHSGPGAYHRAPLAQIAGTDHFDPRVHAAIVDAAVRAVERAHAEARPALLALPVARDRDAAGLPILARNRRRDPDEIDDRIFALRADARDTGETIALLLNYAVHPVTLRRTHMAFGRDLAGEVEEAVSNHLDRSPPVLFLNGAQADVTPRLRPDLGPQQLAAEFAAFVVPSLTAGSGYPLARIRAAAVHRDLGSARAFRCLGSRAAFESRVVPTPLGDDVPSTLASVLAFPANALLWSLGLSDARVGLSFDGAVGALVNLDGLVPREPRRAGALAIELTQDAEGGRPARGVLLWLGGEPTQALGRRWRLQAEQAGAPTPFLLSHTNDSIGYLVTPEEYDEGGYEATATLYGRDTARHVEEALFAALQRVSE